MPDRDELMMEKHFLRSYSDLLIQTCHRRGILAMGGMSAFIPSKDKEKNERAIRQVVQDKFREAEAGHDGAWRVAPAPRP